MADSRNQHVVAHRRWWCASLAVAVPLALAVSQSWIAHAGPAVQSAFTPITPIRALDSRSVGGHAMHFSPTHETDVWQVTLANGIPANATAIVLNLTVADTDATTFLTLWPAGALQPGTSSLDVLPGRTTSTMVVVGLSGAGAIDIFNAAGSADIILD